MTYTAATKPALRRYRAQQEPLGLWPFTQIAEFIVGPQGVGEQTVCVARGEASTADLDAKIGNLNTTWHPTGYYTPAQLLAIVTETRALLIDAGAKIDAAPNSTGDASSVKKMRRDDLSKRHAQGLDFISAANTAKNQGVQIVDAPTLKKWVIGSMNDAASTFAAAFTYECVVSGLQKLAMSLSWMRDLFDKAIAFIKNILGVAYDAAKAILHVAADVAGFAGNMVTYAKWGLIAGVGVWAFLEIKKRRQKK